MKEAWVCAVDSESMVKGRETGRVGGLRLVRGLIRRLLHSFLFFVDSALHLHISLCQAIRVLEVIYHTFLDCISNDNSE